MKEKKIKPLSFDITVKPALKSRGRLYSDKIFPQVHFRQVSKEIVLRVTVAKGGFLQWTPCMLNMRKLRNEELVLRRAVMGGEKMWVPVKPYALEVSSWTDLFMPEVGGSWVLAEGIQGYFKPALISGVTVWVPTPDNNLDKPILTKRGYTEEESLAGNNTYRHSINQLKRNDEYVWERKPSLLLLQQPKKQKSKKEKRREFKRKLVKLALARVAKKLTSKTAASVYPWVDLNSLSDESIGSERPEDKGGEVVAEEVIEEEVVGRRRQQKSSGWPLMGRTGYIGRWEEDLQEEDEKGRTFTKNGRTYHGFCLPGHEVPIVIVEWANL